jgi:hypothetical protein
MPSQLLAQFPVLLTNRKVPVAATPRGDRPQPARQPIRRSLSLHNPRSPSGSAPVVRESQEIEGVPRARGIALTSRRSELEQARLLRVEGQTVLAESFEI